MPILSEYARKKKIRYFLSSITPGSRVLEIGCGSGWVGQYLRAQRHFHYTGIDLHPPADIVGDIRDWRALGLAETSFDVIIAFEVVEHVDCFEACHQLLVPGGRMFITTPVPRMDWLLRLLESLGLNQKRNSPHDHLVNLRDIRGFTTAHVRMIAGLSQWAIFIK